MRSPKRSSTKLSKLKVKHLTRIDDFNTWLIATTHALRSAGLEHYLSKKSRIHASKTISDKQWMILSKQIASWLKHHMDNTLMRVLESRGDALIFADTFIDRAQKVFSKGTIANQWRVKKFMAIKPADYASMSQFVTAYEKEFISMRTYGIETAPYPALLAILSHTEQVNKQVHDKIHLMLEPEIAFATEQGKAYKGTTSALVTVEMFQDFASRTATLLEFDED
ncbi:hypothetical protein N7486_006725 [Penicillium sp. IBT 16267x]|nr:hypothetical protein N7486_006725 [Penicillium sp. IBT 16267x]